MSKFSIKLLQTFCVLFLHIITINKTLFSQDLNSFIEENLSNQPIEKLDTVVLAPDTENDPLALDSLKTPVFKYSTKTFYENRSYEALWYSDIRLLESAQKLLKIIKNISDEGINPERYYLTKLQYLYDQVDKQVDNISSSSYKADLNDLSLLDIEYTEAALKLANDLRFGVIDPAELSLQWEIPRDSVDLTTKLVEAIEQNTLTVFFESLKPSMAPYKNLKSKLKALKQKAEKDTDQIRLKEKQKLEVGTYDEQIVLLRKRVNFLIDLEEQRTPNRLVTPKEAGELSSNRDLQIMEDFSVCYDTIYITRDSIKIISDTTFTTYKNLVKSVNGIAMIYDPTYYDTTLLQNVKLFQKTFGLSPDGIIGPKTIKALNQPFSEMVYKAEMNLDRWRWLSRELTGRYIIVNIAGFYLDVFENDEVALTKQVMVGATKTKTPIFSNILQYIEMNPTWTVPYSISSRELLPKIKNDPGYLARNDYELLSGGSAIDPYSVDWSSIKRSSFPYKIRQKAGKKNALGQIKFMFPNRYSVYVHDTQSKSKFKNYTRAYSHGCIRLETPMELAEYIFKDDPKWNLENLTKALNKRKTKKINLKEPIPIMLLYWTVYVDEGGELVFRGDVYDRDRVVFPIWKRKNRL